MTPANTGGSTAERAPGLRAKLAALLTGSSLLTLLIGYAGFLSYDRSYAGALSSAQLDARSTGLLWVAAATAVMSVVVALLLARWAERGVTRPVAMLTAAARRVQRDQDFHVRVERVGDDELGQLTEALNALLSALEVREGELARQRDALEQRLSERTRELERRSQELRLVLDSVDQGLLTVDRSGQPSGERSAAFDRWFGAPEPGQTFGAIVARRAEGFDRALATQWEQLVDGFLPVELTLAQLPAAISTEDGQHYQLAYRTLGDDPERFEQLLVMVSDVTASMDKAQSDAEHTQLLALIEQLASDRGGAVRFFRETDELVEQLYAPGAAPRADAVVLRELHSLKVSFGLFGLKPLAQLAQEIEAACAERGEPPSSRDLSALQIAWQRLARRAEPFLGENVRMASVDRTALERLLTAIRERKPDAELQRLAARLWYEPVAPKLLRLGERARALAEQLGKGPVEVEVEAEGVVAPAELAWLWQVLPQLVANRVDHGLDAEAERVANGKQPQGRLRIAASEQPSGWVIEVEDDGRGVDWDQVRARAERLGLPTDTHEQLVSALFSSDQRATAPDALEGADLAAVEAACQAHGTHIGVVSKPGEGAVFRVTIANDNSVGSRRKAS